MSCFANSFMHASYHKHSTRHLNTYIYETHSDEFSLVNIIVFIQIILSVVHEGPVDNKAALLLIFVWCLSLDKSQPEPMMSEFTDAYVRHSAWMSEGFLRALGYPNIPYPATVQGKSQIGLAPCTVSIDCGHCYGT